jgi:hypothetical protein
MYWFRTGTPLSFIPWIALSLTWLIGGWLLATHAFRLERRERLIVGVGLGLVPYLWFTNILGHWLAPTLTFALAGILVLLIGVAFAWKGERPFLDWRDFEVYGLILIGLIIAWVFFRIGKGISLFDDRKNLSIISTIASGDIPPHFYMNPGFYFAYHYAFQLFGASMVRIGGLFPWSAFDFSKALVGAYSILLVFLLGKRYIKTNLGGVALSVVYTFAMGTRYLLLLLPTKLYSIVNASVQIGLVDSPFSKALTEGLNITEGPPFPFNIAFLNSINSWPRFMGVQAGPSTLAAVILFLLWLLAFRTKRSSSFILLIIIYSVWGLTWEATYGLFVLGGLLIILYIWIREKHFFTFSQESIALISSIPVVILQGGTITETLRNAIWENTAAISHATSKIAFSFRTPLAIPTTHLGELSIGSPVDMFIAFFEIGPVILFAPLITIWAWQRFQNRDWIIGILIISSWIGFIFPIFFEYSVDRDITRLMAYSLQVWTLLLVIFIWDYTGRWATTLKYAGAVALALMVFGGIVIAGTALTAAPRPVITRGFTDLDAYTSREVWDELPKDSLVFDPSSWRATALTGRLTRSAISSYVRLPEWEQLRRDPYLGDLVESGYDYVYVDEKWWQGISAESRESLSSACVQILSEQLGRNDQFRRLLDISQCNP